MPNHTSNKLEIVGPREVIDEIYNAHCCPEFNFNSWYPMPAALNGCSLGEIAAMWNFDAMLRLRLSERNLVMSQTAREIPSLSQEELCGADNLFQYGHAGWDGWRRAHWGTKWDAYQTSAVREERYLRVDFQTAWSPPEAAIRELAELYPDAEIEMHSLGEGAEFACSFYSDDGQLVDSLIDREDIPAFAHEHFGYDPDEFEEE